MIEQPQKENSRKGGMPSGIPYIIGNESAERFSFYGMKTILIVYMTQFLMLGEAKATIWQHSFVMAAYFLPLAGALLADIWWGKYKTIIRLSLFYCLGHAVIALWENTQGLAIGLGLIAIGAGGIKSCVSSHVGDQFNTSNSHLLERVFGYFYISINVGAFFSTLLTPFLLAWYGPAVAFGLPGILMCLATYVFWKGRKKYIAIPPVGWKAFKKEVFHPDGLRILLKLSFVYVFIAVFWSLYDQTGSTWVLQAERDLMQKTIDLGFIRFEVLPAQIQAVNPLLIILLAPVFSLWVYPFLNRFFRLTYLRKISLGLFITAFSFVIIYWIERNLEQNVPVHVGWQLLAFFVITTAEVLVSITALEFSYTQAPVAMKSLVMGFFWLTVTLGNFITTQVNYFILRPVQIESIVAGPRTYFQVLPTEGIQEGLRIETDKVKSLAMIKTAAHGEADTVVFSGTFIIGSYNPDQNIFEVLDINKRPVSTFLMQERFEPQHVYVHKLKGSSYFLFFTLLMLVAAVLFVLVSAFYREQRFIQEHNNVVRY